MSEFFIYYAESNIVCVIIFSIMLIHDLINVDRQEKQIKYDYTLISFIAYFLSDSIWVAIVSGILPKTRLNISLIVFSNYIFMAAITYSWLNYVLAVEQAPHRNSRISRFAVVFPFLISTILLIITYFSSPELLITESNDTTGLFNVFLVGVPYIYILSVLFYTMKKAVSEENPLEKKKHLYIGLFPLIVIAGGLVEMVILPNTPIFCFACTILMLTFYIQSMETQISMDPLTHLNNRGQLFRYVSQLSASSHDDRLTFVIMIDVNDFKKINDTYGHAEGDRALIIIADSLRDVVRRHNIPIFLGRYGGDEFILIVNPASKDELEVLIQEIRRQIESRCKDGNTPYILSVGAGYDQLMGRQDSFQKCMQRADRNLYLNKEYCKTHGQTTICQ